MLEEGMLNIDTSRAKSGQTMNVRTFKILASDLLRALLNDSGC